MRLLLRTVAIAFGAILVVGCGWIALGFLRLPNPKTEHVKLKSGRDVEKIWSGVVNGRAWVFEYRTHVPTGDLKGLHNEAEAIWPGVKEQAERAGQSKASLWPIDFRRQVRFSGWRPIVIGQRMTPVSFERSADGIWRVSNPLPPGY